MASYQIKSTPYFRRIINNSRNNGQLQNLREEYDRIQQFNDRTIEKKMRQVRLKRLFRQIEGLKVLQATTSRSSEALALSNRRAPFVVNPSPVDTTQRQRFEAIARSREFGKEISRRNALSLQQGGGLHRFGLRSTIKKRSAAEASRAEIERRERTIARITYGNAQSKCNIQKITQRRMRSRHSHHTDSQNSEYHLHRELSQSLDLVNQEKRTKLQHRLAYGNAQSFSNKERAAAIAIRRTAAAAAAATGTTNEMVHPTGFDMDSNYYDDDLEASSDEDDYEDFQSAMLLTPKQSPHDLCRKKTMILKRNVGGSNSDKPLEDDCNTISDTRLRARKNWIHLLTLTLPWVSLLQNCQDESGTNLFVSATETSSDRQPIVNKKLTLASDSYQDILSNNESTGIIDGARTAIINSVNINTQRQGNNVAAAPGSISVVLEGGEEVSEPEEINSEEKYPNPESEHYFFEDYEEGLEAESPTSGVEESSSEADNVLTHIGYHEFKNKNQVNKSNLSLNDHAESNTQDDVMKVDDDDDQGECYELLKGTLGREGFWHTAVQTVVVTKSGIPIQTGNVSRLRKVFEH